MSPRKEITLIPETYEQWRTCITIDCGLPLTKPFIAQRLAVLRDVDSDETVRFRQRYGDQHWQSVLGWFEKAAQI